MKDDKILKQELDELSNKAAAAADELCEIFRAFDKIDAGKPEGEEETSKYRQFLFETDRRRAIILRRILIEFGGLLYLWN